MSVTTIEEVSNRATAAKQVVDDITQAASKHLQSASQPSGASAQAKKAVSGSVDTVTLSAVAQTALAQASSATAKEGATATDGAKAAPKAGGAKAAPQAGGAKAAPQATSTSSSSSSTTALSQQLQGLLRQLATEQKAGDGQGDNNGKVDALAKQIKTVLSKLAAASSAASGSSSTSSDTTLIAQAQQAIAGM